jgi:outer membrane protein, adhesin transport system
MRKRFLFSTFLAAVLLACFAIPAWPNAFPAPLALKAPENSGQSSAPVEKAPSEEKSAVTLADAVRHAVSTHPAVLAGSASRLAAEEDVSVAKSGRYPKLRADAAGGYQQSHNEATRTRAASGIYSSSYKGLWRNEQSLTLSQLLFDGFGTEGRIDAAEMRFMGAGERELDIAERIGLRAVEAYLDVLRMRQLASLAKENVEHHRLIQEMIAFKADSGAGPMADLRQVEARLAGARAGLLEMEGGLRDAETRFREAFGVAPDGLLLPDAPAGAVSAGEDEAVARALKEDRALKASKAVVEERRAELDVAHSAYYPKVDMELSSSRDENQDGVIAAGHDYVAELKFSFEIFNGGGDLAKGRKARQALLQAQHDTADRAREVEKEARTAYNALVTASVRLPVLRTGARKNIQVLEAYQDQFRLGKRRLLDVLDAQTGLFNSLVGLTNGEMAHLFSHYRMLAAMSRLLITLGVEVQDAPKESRALRDPS